MFSTKHKDQKPNNYRVYKVVLLCDMGVGKSRFIEMVQGRKVEENKEMDTLGFRIHSIPWPREKKSDGREQVVFQVWDFSGDEL